MIKNIFFDFDGVILESVSIKTDAFYEMYLPYGKETAEKVKAFHLANGGVSRFDKFRYFAKEFLGEKIDEAKIQMLAEQFGKLVMDKILECPYVPGAIEFLENHSQDYNCFVVSATPHEEINYIVKKKGIEVYFKSIHGFPTKKTEIVAKLVDYYRMDVSESLFIGDAEADYIAAFQNDLHFLLRKTPENVYIFKEKNMHSTPDLTKLHHILKKNKIFI
jgi:phosphoglycolate phosphatase-like HAD superfamily hydrolase